MMKRNNKKEEFVTCEKCKKKEEKAECILNDKLLKTFICHKCFSKDNNIIEDPIDDDVQADI